MHDSWLLNDEEWERWLEGLKEGDYAKLQGRTVRVTRIPKKRLGIVVLLGDEDVIVPSVNLEPPSPLEELAGAAE